jgi:hypothetical protein
LNDEKDDGRRFRGRKKEEEDDDDDDYDEKTKKHTKGRKEGTEERKQKKD